MWLTVQLRKKDDYGKSGRKVEIQKNISKQKKKKAKSAFYEKGKAHKKSDLVILKAMIKDDDGNLAFGDK